MEFNLKNILIAGVTASILTSLGISLHSSSKDDDMYRKQNDRKFIKNINTKLLLSKGLIDQKTANNIEEYISKKESNKISKIDKVQELDRVYEKVKIDNVIHFNKLKSKTQFHSFKNPKRIDILDEMVTEGIITQIQSYTIRAFK